ncbi:MAG: APC family permease [Myxococcales bacterium]
MSVLDWLLGRPLSAYEEERESIGSWAGVPILGLDALSSAAYGPEAALTLLLPLGALGLRYVAPITAIIVLVLLLVFLSYRQTIAAYPNGGGSYTVSKENLGQLAGLLAGAALALDYVLNVAVGISSGVGALASAVPSLLPHTLALCLVILAFLTVTNLRGLAEAGAAFALPTYAFLGSLGAVVVIGLAKTLLAGGHPVPVAPPPPLPSPTEAVGLWLLLKAFASGCTAMTGVEAVSNAVPVFREPRIPLARRTLTVIILALAALLGGIAWLCLAYGIGATVPGEPGYQSVLSMVTAAVVGRGIFYRFTMLAVVSVLALSANTSFADFPRLCHMLAHDGYLPDAFAVRGRRLVYTGGILVLAALAAGLLVLFGGITDRLIPLFAIGAFLAFTLSQAGMVRHWLRVGGARGSLWINAVGAGATGLTLAVIAVSKFAEGAWLTLLAVPLLVYLFLRVKRHYRDIERQIATVAPLEPPEPRAPVVVLPVAAWNRVSQHGLSFALRLSSDVHVVQVRTETDDPDELEANWDLLIRSRARACGLCEPKLVILTSDFREFFRPLIDYVLDLEAKNEDRDIAVVIPDLVLPHWYESLLHNNRGTFLRTLLRLRGSSRVVIVNTPYHLRPDADLARLDPSRASLAPKTPLLRRGR